MSLVKANTPKSFLKPMTVVNKMCSEEVKIERSGTIAIIGPANAGKSTLLNRIVGEKVSIVSAKANTTRNRILAIKNLDKAQLIFIDSPGFVGNKKKSALGGMLERTHQDVASGTDLVLWVVDSAELINRKCTLDQTLAEFSKRGVPSPDVVALNKTDLFPPEKILPIISELDRKLSSKQTQIVPVSALTGESVENLLSLLDEKLPEGPALFPLDTVTDQTESSRATELIREQLFRQLRQEIPYGTAVLLEKWDEDDEAIRIHAKILVEQESHKGMVIGKAGSRLASIGKASRTQLSRVFGVPVHLKLFVGVEKNWSQTEKGLEKLRVAGGLGDGC